MKRLSMITITLFCLALILPLPAQPFAQPRGPGDWHHGMGMGGWFGPFGMFIFWIITIVVIVLVVRWLISLGREPRTINTQETALDILKKRYASGEITKDEFERMRKEINRPPE